MRLSLEEIERMTQFLDVDTATLKRHFPPNTCYYAKTYAPEGIPQAEWHLSEASVKRVLEECERIPHYLSIGHIAEIQREDGAFV